MKSTVLFALALACFGTVATAKDSDLTEVYKFENAEPAKAEMDLAPPRKVVPAVFPASGAASSSARSPSALPMIGGAGYVAGTAASGPSATGVPAPVYSNMADAAKAGVDPLDLRKVIKKVEPLKVEDAAATGWLGDLQRTMSRFENMSAKELLAYGKANPAHAGIALSILLLLLITAYRLFRR